MLQECGLLLVYQQYVALGNLHEAFAFRDVFCRIAGHQL